MRFISLFSGIDAASVAWVPLGWKCAAFAEIDKFPCAVLARHYINIPNLGNVCNITREMLIKIGPVDAVVFGFPCQDLSVAGKRAGLEGARSGLFFEAMRIVEICRDLWGTRWTIVENVPGLFSSNLGADFATVVGTMVGAEFAVPKSRWQNTGVALGPLGLVEWAVLDAQWFGVPQRRRRVFLVRDSGDWRSRPPVLSFPESLCGNTPPSREKGQSAPTIPSRRSAGGGLGTDFDCDGGLIESRIPSVIRERERDVSHPLTCHQVKMGDPTTDNYIVTGGFFDHSTHSLRAEEFDASEDGTGRGTPLVPVAFQSKQSSTAQGPSFDAVSPSLDVAKAGGLAVAYRTNAAGQVDNQGDLSAALTSQTDPCTQFLAFSCKDSGADCGDQAPTLRSMNFDSSVGTLACNTGPNGHDAGNFQSNQGVDSGYIIPVAFVQNTRDEVRLMGGDGQIVGALAAEPGMKQQCYLAFGFSAGQSAKAGSIAYQPEQSPTLRGTASGTNQVPGVAIGIDEEQNATKDGMGCLKARREGGGFEGSVMTPAMQVRRLTPVECERLQGFPDGYTKINEKTADGPRYKALGNSMAVPCMEWIGRRIQLVDLLS